MRTNNHEFRFKDPLYSLDASVIDLSLNLFPWVKCHQAKAAMKLYVGLNNTSLIPEFTALSHGLESELIKAVSSISQKEALLHLIKDITITIGMDR